MTILVCFSLIEVKKQASFTRPSLFKVSHKWPLGVDDTLSLSQTSSLLNCLPVGGDAGLESFLLVSCLLAIMRDLVSLSTLTRSPLVTVLSS